MGMDQYLLIPFLGEWTSIYQLFWCELQGYKVLTHCHMIIKINQSPVGLRPWIRIRNLSSCRHLGRGSILHSLGPVQPGDNLYKYIWICDLTYLYIYIYIIINI